MSEYKGGPDGPEGADDGYVDHGGLYWVEDIDGRDLVIDLEVGDGHWERNDGARLTMFPATPTEVALARRLHETEAYYQRQIAALVKERDELLCRVDAVLTKARTGLKESL